MSEDLEIWANISTLGGNYHVSNFGRIKSVERMSWNGKVYHAHKERIMRQVINKYGYFKCSFSVLGVSLTINTHTLVAIGFLGHNQNRHAVVVDHINGDKSDNRLANLRLVTNRENCTICFRKNKGMYSSRFVGVSWSSPHKKWRAQIQVGGKTKHIGLFSDENAASAAYQAELKLINTI